MTLKWRRDGYFGYANELDDGSLYLIMQLQGGRTYVSVWQWPTERRYKTDGRWHMMDRLYDGPDKLEAVRVCNEHYERQNDRIPS